MAHRRSKRGGFEKTIDQIRWAGASHLFAAQAVGSSAQVLVTDGDKETILRIRGEIVCFAEGALTGGQLVRCALGALVVQAGSSTTVIQKPLTDPQAPWLMYEQWTVGYEEIVSDVVDVPGITSYRTTVDSKAMRILRPGREVQLVFESVSLVSTLSVNVHFGFRMLLGQN